VRAGPVGPGHERRHRPPDDREGRTVGPDGPRRSDAPTGRAGPGAAPAGPAAGPVGVTPGWEERWWFDFAAADDSVAGFARLAFRPAERTASWWAAVVGPDRALVSLRADDLRLPARGLEVRGDGVWACATCETPLEHWSVGLEAFAAQLDDPLDALGSERGVPTPLGFDLEWESLAPASWAGGPVTGYAQACRVDGEVLVGPERLAIGGAGHREHSWGRAESDRPGWRVTGFGCRGPRAGPARGWWARGGPGPEGWLADGPGDTVAVRLDADGPTSGAAYRLGGPDGAVGPSVSLVPVALAPVSTPGGPALHSLCRVVPEPGSDPGWAWVSRRPGRADDGSGQTRS